MSSADGISQKRKRGRPRKIQALNATSTSDIHPTCQNILKMMEETAPGTVSLTNIPAPAASETVQIVNIMTVTKSMENSSIPHDNGKPDLSVNTVQLLDNSIAERVTGNASDSTIQSVRRPRGRPRKFPQLKATILDGKLLENCRLSVDNVVQEDLPVNSVAIAIRKNLTHMSDNTLNISTAARRPRGRPQKLVEMSSVTTCTDSHGTVALRPKDKPGKLTVPYPTLLGDSSDIYKSRTPDSDPEKFVLSSKEKTVQLLPDGKIRQLRRRPRKYPRPMDMLQLEAALVQQSENGTKDLVDGYAENLQQPNGIDIDSISDHLLDIADLILKEASSDSDDKLYKLIPANFNAGYQVCDQNSSSRIGELEPATGPATVTQEQKREIDSVHVGSLKNDVIYCYRNPDWHHPVTFSVCGELDDCPSSRSGTTKSKIPDRCLDADVPTTSQLARCDSLPAPTVRPRGRPRKMPRQEQQPQPEPRREQQPECRRPRGRPRKNNFTSLDKAVLRNSVNANTTTTVNNVVAKPLDGSSSEVEAAENNNKIVSSLVADGSSQPRDAQCNDTSQTILITEVQSIKDEVFALI